MTLAGLQQEYRGQLVSDFQRYYHGTPERLLDDGVPLADVAAMAANLPRDSATMLAVAPQGEAEFWGVEAYLLANVVDLLAGANWQRAGGKSTKPKPTGRPQAPKKRNARGYESPADFRAWYEAQPGGRKLTTE